MKKFPQVRYFASKKNKFIEITRDPVNGVCIKEVRPVSGKIEARKLTSDMNGIAWNF